MSGTPVCRCSCGHSLTIQDAVSRVFLSEYAGWERYYLRFRCPRCRRPVEKHFEARVPESPLYDVEFYERAAPSQFGPITEEEQTAAVRLLNSPLGRQS